MKTSILLGATTFALFTAATASAAPTVYQGYDRNNGPGASLLVNPNSTAARNAFNAQLTGVSTESFETFATNTSAPINLTFTGSAGLLTATLSGTGSVQSATRAAPTGSGQYATDGSKYYQVDSADFTVTFGTPVSAFGFFATDLEDAPNINFTINFTGGGSQAYNLATLFGYGPSDYDPTFLPSGGVHFLGFIDTAQTFDSVVFGGTGAAGDILAFDEMQIGDRQQVTGGVPEPATWAMMIMGFGAVGGTLRRRTAKAAFA